MVALVSHIPLGDPPQRPTSMYNLPTRMSVEGEETINLGLPNLVHYTRLKQMSMPVTIDMNASDVEALMSHDRDR